MRIYRQITYCIMQAPPVTSSVEKAFRPAFDEISRRSAAGKEYSSNRSTLHEPTFFSRTNEGIGMSFVNADQVWVLLSIGTAVTAPRPLDPTRPAARIYGAFPTKEDAKEHADVIREMDAACSLLVVKMGEWVLFPMNEKTRDDPEYMQTRIEQRLAEYKTTQEKASSDFELEVNERRERASASLPKEDNREEKEEEADAERTVYAPPKRIRAGAEVRGQASATVCVVRDELGEVLLRVLGCFESTIEADAWCQNVGSRQILDHDIFVTPTCEWFYPNGEPRMSSRANYRIDELQRIMDAAVKNPEDVKSYKEWKKEQDRLKEEDRLRESHLLKEEEDRNKRSELEEGVSSSPPTNEVNAGADALCDSDVGNDAPAGGETAAVPEPRFE